MCLRFDVIDTVDFFLETKHGLIFRGSSLAACRKGGSQPERSSTSTPPYLAIVEREECRCSDLENGFSTSLAAHPEDRTGHGGC